MKKHILAIVLALTLTFFPGVSTNAQTVDRNCPAKVRCEVDNLSVRCGPGTNYEVIGTCTKGQELTCLGKMGSWYVVQLPNDTIGLCSDVYCEPSYQ